MQHLISEHQTTQRAQRSLPLSAALVPAVAQLLASAFEIDPAYRYLFPDAATRTIGLTDYFTRTLRLHVAKRCSHVSVDAHDIPCATVTLRPPAGLQISTLSMLRHGLIPFAFARGVGAVKRLLWLKHTYDALELEASRGAPHQLVHMMAVDPRHQGRGLGSELLSTVLRQTSAPKAASVLTTHLPQNLTFYQRLGFRVLHERILHPPGAEPYRVWSMRLL